MANQQLRVWWIPQIPMQSFLVPVKDTEQAALILMTLALYDDFQYKNNIKPDYSNVGGLEIFEGGEWAEWYDDDTGLDIHEYIDELNQPSQDSEAD